MGTKTDRELYNELAYYTYEHAQSDASFMHQLVVDAYAAQHPYDSDKPIRVAFALIGLYLHIEKHYTGRQVQLAHIALGKERRAWPTFTPPAALGSVTVADVVRSEPGSERDRMIEAWCVSVWDAWAHQQQTIRDLVRSELNI
jgi:hypothetical protein